MPYFIESILPHAAPWLLVLTRLGGLFIFAPILSSPVLPRQIRVLMLVALTAVVYPTTADSIPTDLRLDLIDLAPLLLQETMIGASIGLIAAIPLYAMQLAGLLMGQQMGLGIAQVLNPASDIQGDNIGQVLFLMALGAFVMVGGIELLFGAVVHTLHTVPIGCMAPEQTPVQLIAGLLGSGFNLAFRVALPVIAIIFIENVAMGFLMKTVPSLNIMNFGFPLRIIAGLLAVVGSVEMIRNTTEIDLDNSLVILRDWVGSLHISTEGSDG